MEQLEHPDEATWEDRRLWFEERQQVAAKAGAGQISEQAAALLIELQTTFCAGAWAATVILAGAVVDAQSFYSGFPADGLKAERDWLRGLRNDLLHENRRDPAFTVEDHWTRREEWRRNAKRAVETAFACLYGLQERRPRRKRRILRG